MNIVPLSIHSDFTARHAPQPALTRSKFPQDAHAVIYKPAPSPISSGRAHTGVWKLRFARRSAPYIEPLMGWTADDDTLTQVELSFSSAESAVAYARRQGLDYTVQGLPEQESKLRLISDNSSNEGEAASKQRRRQLEWIERTLGPDLLRRGSGAVVDSAASYAAPQDVLRDRSLSQDCKRDILRRWALDAYQIELEHSRGKAQAEASRLQEVIDALLDLEEPRITAECFHHVNKKAG
jgi:hypothetical protein